tara:strand:- start:290 stop:445 length:156 start_codon:yes stop_codon:yes gene_type:complete
MLLIGYYLESTIEIIPFLLKEQFLMKILTELEQIAELILMNTEHLLKLEKN